jgi:hypothetical protein
MDNPDEDLVIIGSGYLDIKNKFRERPSEDKLIVNMQR